jgi:hypothetical protein
MKKSSIYLAISVTVLSLIVVFILPAKTQAQVACPTGYTCTPIIVNCPTGYKCIANNASSNASNTASLTNALSAIKTTPVTSQAVRNSPNVSTNAGGFPIPVGNPADYNATAIQNSIFSDNLTPIQANGNRSVFYYIPPSTPEFLTIPISSTIPQSTVLNASLSPSGLCKNPVSINGARELIKTMANLGIDASFIMSTAREYITGGMAVYAIEQRLSNSQYQSAFAPPAAGYCLDAGYVSDYPTYVKNFTAFVNSHPTWNIIQPIIASQYYPFGH